MFKVKAIKIYFGVYNMSRVTMCDNFTEAGREKWKCTVVRFWYNMEIGLIFLGVYLGKNYSVNSKV